jgi:uncharacterized protein YpmB
MILIIIPSLLLGAFVGSTISSMLPELVQMAGLVLVLIIATFKGFKKSMAVYKKETKEIQKEKQKDDKIEKVKRKKSSSHSQSVKTLKNHHAKKKKMTIGKKEEIVIAESSADELGGKATDFENNLESGTENEPVIVGARNARKVKDQKNIPKPVIEEVQAESELSSLSM